MDRGHPNRAQGRGFTHIFEDGARKRAPASSTNVLPQKARTRHHCTKAAGQGGDGAGAAPTRDGAHLDCAEHRRDEAAGAAVAGKMLPQWAVVPQWARQCEKTTGAAKKLKLKSATQSSRRQWEVRRRRHKQQHELVGRGGSDGSKETIRRINHLVLKCRKKGCGALVSYQKALEQAKAAGRHTFAPGDGCSSSTCSKRHQRGVFKRRQAERAAALRAGERWLVGWPSATGKTKFRAKTARAARAAANRAVTQAREA